MASYLVTGPTRLAGHVAISGNKNAILKLLPASLIASSPSTFTNVPDIADVAVTTQILSDLGAKITSSSPSSLTVDPAGLASTPLDPQKSSSIRSSVMFISPLLARFGQVTLGFPGGDKIGKRGLGTHFEALRALGATFDVSPTTITAKLVSPPTQAVEIFLDEASVTATENVLILAACQPHATTIIGAACEPHVVCLGNYLTKLGAQISGLGTNLITVTGSTNLAGTTHAVRPDYMDAGTFAIAAAISGSSLTISPASPQDLRMTLLYLSRFGVQYTWPQPDTLQILPSTLAVDPEHLGIRQKFQTRPWPGFPADLMSPLIVLATQATGSVLLHDWMYETRMFFTDKLVSMGANITLCDPHRIIVTGPTPLFGRHLASPDIRAGMSLLLAALIAQGDSAIDHAEIIERGYEHPDARLNALGAKIQRVDSHD